MFTTFNDVHFQARMLRLEVGEDYVYSLFPGSSGSTNFRIKMAIDGTSKQCSEEDVKIMVIDIVSQLILSSDIDTKISVDGFGIGFSWVKLTRLKAFQAIRFKSRIHFCLQHPND